ncbi:hypothetical protein B0J13DRAFT_566244 [Dactylonectria estremocensis]|uniref:RING-type E3 ubiquitin transferase n=1 Tax=Dactylonectria estremocensis TaxID=1079267 RepID=A0A9P9IK50_9HYPO|nr:hypothetical protein B0J13DRAFT_566244 [Dactylonectria estremocensis]
MISGHQPCDGGIQIPREVFTRDSKPVRRQSEPRCSHQSECPICTEEFADGVLVRLLPCEHVFHPACIDPWLERRARTCPLWYAITRLREECWRYWRFGLTSWSSRATFKCAFAPNFLPPPCEHQAPR